MLEAHPGIEPVLLLENDQKEDGRWPGRDNGLRFLAELRKRYTLRPVPVAFTPHDKKDVRVWHNDAVKAGATDLMELGDAFDAAVTTFDADCEPKKAGGLRFVTPDWVEGRCLRCGHVLQLARDTGNPRVIDVACKTYECPCCGWTRRKDRAEDLYAKIGTAAVKTIYKYRITQAERAKHRQRLQTREGVVEYVMTRDPDGDFTVWCTAPPTAGREKEFSLGPAVEMTTTEAAQDAAEAVLYRPLENSKRFVSSSEGWRPTPEPPAEKDGPGFENVAVLSGDVAYVRKMARRANIRQERPLLPDFAPDVLDAVDLERPEDWDEDAVYRFFEPIIKSTTGRWRDKFPAPELIHDSDWAEEPAAPEPEEPESVTEHQALLWT
jgi:hypothetical protein